MRRVLSGVLSALLLGGQAFAGPGQEFADWAAELQSEAYSRASIAARMPAADAQPLDIEDPFYFELEQFAADAMRLSRLLADHGGPQDLQCIFRGMSADAEARLEALNAAERQSEQARIYRAIADLMRDASEIGPAVDDSEIAVEGLPTCPSRP